MFIVAALSVLVMLALHNQRAQLHFFPYMLMSLVPMVLLIILPMMIGWALLARWNPRAARRMGANYRLRARLRPKQMKQQMRWIGAFVGATAFLLTRDPVISALLLFSGFPLHVLIAGLLPRLVVNASENGDEPTPCLVRAAASQPIRSQ